MANAIGYYKVFATEGQDVRDATAWPARPSDRVLQWIFPFTEDSCDAMRERAINKAGNVSWRLDGAPISDIKRIKGLKNAFAIRVGKEHGES